MSYPNLSQDSIDSITAFFNYVDSDHDGFITYDEIKVAMEVDLNGDGTITPEESVISAAEWVNSYFSSQDINTDQKISLSELLIFNNNNI